MGRIVTGQDIRGYMARLAEEGSGLSVARLAEATAQEFGLWDGDGPEAGEGQAVPDELTRMATDVLRRLDGWQL